MPTERRTQRAGLAPLQGRTLVLTATRRREDLVLALADVILACAAGSEPLQSR